VGIVVVVAEVVVVVAFVDQEMVRGCCASWLGKMDFILVSVGPVRLVVLVLIGIGPPCCCSIGVPKPCWGSSSAGSFNGVVVVVVVVSAPARVLVFAWWWMGETPHQAAWAFVVVRVLAIGVFVLGSSTMV
jgi:hypothetical protein